MGVTVNQQTSGATESMNVIIDFGQLPEGLVASLMEAAAQLEAIVAEIAQIEARLEAIRPIIDQFVDLGLSVENGQLTVEYEPEEE